MGHVDSSPQDTPLVADPDLLGAMNHELMRAIADKRLIEFVYRIGQIRIVEPHDYGVRRGVERPIGFQISGASRSGASHGWKEFDVEEIQQLRVLERRFAGTRADKGQPVEPGTRCSLALRNAFSARSAFAARSAMKRDIYLWYIP